MKGSYDSVIVSASRILATTLMEDSRVTRDVLGVDGEVRSVLRRVGQKVVEAVLQSIVERTIDEAKASGLTRERRMDIDVRTLFGVVTVPSPYMVSRATGARERPVKSRLGLYGGMKTPAVERALADFAAEESCALAAQRFEEHYGQEVGRTSVLRVVKQVATEAEKYVTTRLATAAQAFSEPLLTRPGVDRILVELDGCMIRTGTLSPANNGEVTAVRGLPRRTRDESWREVRVGLARDVDSMDRTYVARMDKYEPVVNDLFGAAADRGLSERTRVYAVADGGNGLREELEVQFSGLRFLLDRMHLKSHLHETADACGLDAAGRAVWTDAAMTLIDAGHVKDVIAQLNSTAGAGEDRAKKLAGYLRRFQDALDYIGAANDGLPVGSGEIESAHRYIPQKRLKIPGACWLPSTVTAMLGLRVLRANRWWSDFWEERNAHRRSACA